MNALDNLNESQINDIIGMAWCDKTPFERIKNHCGLSEKEVKALMRKELKASSYRLWRKRVTGRSRKHEKKGPKLIRQFEDCD